MSWDSAERWAERGSDTRHEGERRRGSLGLLGCDGLAEDRLDCEVGPWAVVEDDRAAGLWRAPPPAMPAQLTWGPGPGLREPEAFEHGAWVISAAVICEREQRNARRGHRLRERPSTPSRSARHPIASICRYVMWETGGVGPGGVPQCPTL